MSTRELRNCRICGTVFLYHGGIVVCEECRRDLDEVYARAREVLRDKKSSEAFDSIHLAEEIGVDPIYIHILVEGGFFERDGFELEEETAARKGLARAFEAELNRKKPRNPEKKTSSRGMFLDERRRKNR